MYIPAQVPLPRADQMHEVTFLDLEKTQMRGWSDGQGWSGIGRFPVPHVEGMKG